MQHYIEYIAEESIARHSLLVLVTMQMSTGRQKRDGRQRDLFKEVSCKDVHADVPAVVHKPFVIAELGFSGRQLRVFDNTESIAYLCNHANLLVRLCLFKGFGPDRDPFEL